VEASIPLPAIAGELKAHHRGPFASDSKEAHFHSGAACNDGRNC